MAMKKVSFYIEEEDFEHVKRLADKIDDKKSTGNILRKLVKMGLDDALALEKIGVLDTVLCAGKVINVLRKKFLAKNEDITLEDFK